MPYAWTSPLSHFLVRSPQAKTELCVCRPTWQNCRAGDFSNALIASFSGNTIIMFREYFLVCSADTECSRLATPTKLGSRATAMKTGLAINSKQKSSTTRRRGLLRMAISTAPHLSGSGRVDVPMRLVFYLSGRQHKLKYDHTSRLEMASFKCAEIHSRAEKYGSCTAIQ